MQSNYYALCPRKSVRERHTWCRNSFVGHVEHKKLSKTGVTPPETEHRCAFLAHGLQTRLGILRRGNREGYIEWQLVQYKGTNGDKKKCTF